MAANEAQLRRFAIAVSFPGQHRRFVLNVVKCLADHLGRDRVFYDEWYESELVGLDGDLKLRRYYREQSELVVPFFSEHYAKDWCQIEWSAIRAMLKERRKDDAVVPVALDGTRIEGWETIDFAIRKANRNGREIADLIYAAYRQRYPEEPSRTASPPPSDPHGHRVGTPVPLTPRWNHDVSRILKYAPAQLIGREHELNLLTAAWKGDLQAPADSQVTTIRHRPKVLTFVALGGEGKTSLVAKWAAELAAQDWLGCDAAFAWSFYSQGTREQLAASSDLFLQEALTFFGDDADKVFAASPAGAYEKGQRLARLVGQRRGLLILDGLEPLQYAPGSPTPGQLKDQGIAALLKGLATTSHGLCVVTTRYSLPDLKAFWQTTAPEVKLLRLSREAGVHLLKSFNIRGSDRKNIPFNSGKELLSEFEKLVEDVKGHALTLTLLGGFLKRAFRGDICQRDRVKFEKADEKMDGGHAFRTMAAYEQWLLRDGGDEGRREVAVMRLMGLFDRPADAGCINALLQPPAITGLTEPLVGLPEDDWEFCLTGLETTKLLTINRDASAIPHSNLPFPHSLDAHPLLREYFARQLRTQQPDAWRAAHRRLYEHLCETAPECTTVNAAVEQITQQFGLVGGTDKPPPTLEELQPLYQAVVHGCQADLQQEAHDEVHLRRIRRGGREDYSVHKLGAFGSDLGALACFFETPWSKPSRKLRERDKAILLNNTAFCLRGLGRLTEAIEPMRAGLDEHARQGNLDQAACSAGNLSEMELTLGEVAAAVRGAEQSVSYADRSDDEFLRKVFRATHADALFQAGHRPEAEKRFRETEQMQVEREPDYPLLYSLPGFRYCDLLLAAPERAAWQMVLQGEATFLSPGSGAGRSAGEVRLATAMSPLLDSCRAVSQRAAQTLKIAESNNRLLDIALGHLALGRAALHAVILGNAEGGMRSAEWEKVKTELDAAVAGLRRAASQDHLPRGLLARAWLRFLTGARTGPESAQEELDEAWEIAERGPMRLHMADIHLHRARLFFREAQYPWESPQADLAAAEKLINECGYHRRDEELADAEAAICQNDPS